MKEIEVSVVLPCLNEEKTVKVCIEKALKVFEENDIEGEVVVADNGSTDHSVQIAEKAGARVIHQPKKGYGSAYLKGFSEARGEYLVMGDADDTYDFSEIERFLKPLRDGYDLVIGTRLKGKILPGAMPWLHRYVGNPLLTGILNSLFKAGVSDCHCGMRALAKEAARKLNLQTSGMEFASEMVIKAAKNKLRIKELPITYYPRKGKSKLNSFDDGWHHLRFMLLFSPFHLFLLPGFVLFFTGAVLVGLLLKRPLIINGITFDVHPMFVGSLLVVLGYQIIILGLYTKIYRVTNKLSPSDRTIEFIFKHITLERGLLFGLIVFLTGFMIDLTVLLRWVRSGFGSLDGIREALFALTLTIVGIQTIFSSFFLSILGVEKK